MDNELPSRIDDRLRSASNEMTAVNPHRINVLGASGAGTSTIGRALATSLGVPHFESDDYYHAPSDPPFQSVRSPQERHALITTDLNAAPFWILSGGVAGWDPFPQLDFTLMVFVWTPTPIRIERLRRREYERFGERIREGGDMHRAHEEFIEWASRYDVGDVDGKTLARHEPYLATQTCPVIQLRDVKPIDEMIDTILSAFSEFKR